MRTLPFAGTVSLWEFLVSRLPEVTINCISAQKCGLVRDAEVSRKVMLAVALACPIQGNGTWTRVICNRFGRFRNGQISYNRVNFARMHRVVNHGCSIKGEFPIFSAKDGKF
jgi:hypothetical protein